MGEIQEFTIGSLIEDRKAHLQTGPFGTMLNASEYTINGTPVIAVQDIGENELRHDKFVFVPDDVAERLSRYRVKKNDIIFGRKGAVERRALIKNNEDGWLQGSDCIRLRLDDSIDPRFVAYQLGDNYHRNWLQQFATGATMPSLNQEVLKMLPLFLPDLPEQKAITEVLSSLDDKIVLLHRQNKTLESLAQTLFRQWFIEESDESWKTRTIVEFAPVITGKKDANYGSEDGIYPFFTCSQKALKCDYFSYEGHAILLAGNGDFNLKRYKGKFEAYQRTYILIPYDEKYVGFLFYLMKYFLDEITSSAQGSVISFLTKGMITDFEFLFPDIWPEPHLLKLNLIDERIDTNLRQIQTISKLRDALLPKLMSGEVRV